MTSPHLFEEEIARTAGALRAHRQAWRAGDASRRSVPRFPSPARVGEAVTAIAAALFPRRLGGFVGDGDATNGFVAARLRHGFYVLQQEIAAEIDYWQAENETLFEPDHANMIVRHFAGTLPGVRKLVDSDVEAAFVGDPAARSIHEILISYPGAHAILYHRLAHELHLLGAAIVARVISELANGRTGIDIHPGASIGPHFFIDHGTGVVIGETAVIGANVRLYQHVTLGARSPLGATRNPNRFIRHPTVEDNVVIYAGATILGPVTIGRDSIIGGNVWLLQDVPPGSVVVQPQAQRLPDRAAWDVAETLANASD